MNDYNIGYLVIEYEYNNSFTVSTIIDIYMERGNREIVELQHLYPDSDTVESIDSRYLENSHVEIYEV